MKKVAVIGGDLRIIKLIEMLAKDDFEINVYGLERTSELSKFNNVKEKKTLKDALKDVEIVLGPIPLSSNKHDLNLPFSDNDVTIKELGEALGERTFIAGSICQEMFLAAKDANIIDLLNREELTVLNTISTAEGAIQIAMEETSRTLHGSNVLVMGFGRIGKVLSNMLDGIGANVYCEARKNVDLAWIRAYGYTPVHLKEIDTVLPKVDIIINTIPYIVLDDEKIKLINKDTLVVDLASNPGGIDKKAAKKSGLKVIWALSLPGKVAPITSAEFIKDTLYNILKEL